MTLGLKLPGRGIPLYPLFAMPIGDIARELERRVAAAAPDGDRKDKAILLNLFRLRLNRPSYWASLAGLVVLHLAMRMLEMELTISWLYASYILSCVSTISERKAIGLSASALLPSSSSCRKFPPRCSFWRSWLC